MSEGDYLSRQASQTNQRRRFDIPQPVAYSSTTDLPLDSQESAMLGMLTKAIRTTLQARVMALLLVPAIILGTTPRNACACADGHLEFSCNARTCSAKDQQGRCCCAKTNVGKSCCATKKVTNSRSGCADSTGLQIKSQSCCCTPVLIASPAITLAKESPAVENSTTNFVATAMLPCEMWPTLVQRNSFACNHAPPPVDRVIVFLHLTI